MILNKYFPIKIPQYEFTILKTFYWNITIKVQYRYLFVGKRVVNKNTQRQYYTKDVSSCVYLFSKINVRSHIKHYVEKKNIVHKIDEESTLKGEACKVLIIRCVII